VAACNRQCVRGVTLPSNAAYSLHQATEACGYSSSVVWYGSETIVKLNSYGAKCRNGIANSVATIIQRDASRYAECGSGNKQQYQVAVDGLAAAVTWLFNDGIASGVS